MSLASAALSAMRAAVSSGISSTVSFLANFPSRARAAISALPGQVSSVASSAMNSVRSAISNGISSAVSTLRGFAGRAKSAVGNLGGALVGAGRDLVMGLVNGIKGAVGQAVSAAVGVGRAVISGIKSTLKIGSPSKVMFEFGGWTGDGLVDGIMSKIQAVRAAATSLANTVIAPTMDLRGTTGLSGVVGGAASATAAAAQGAALVVNQVVNAIPGQSARQVADYSISRLKFATQGATSALPAPLPAGV